MATFVPLSNVLYQLQDTVTSDNLSGGTIEFFLAGTATPTNLFSDNAGTSIGTSITLNSGGIPESGGNTIMLWRDVSISLKLTFKNAAGTVIHTEDNLATPDPFYPTTADETTAGVTPVNFQYPELDARRYGTNTTPGTTDMATALQAALDVANTKGGGIVKLQPEIYRVDSGLTVYGGTVLQGSGRGQYFSTFASNTATIIRAGAAMADMIITDENSGTAGGAALQDLIADGANNATDVVSMQGIRDALRFVTVARGGSVGVHQNVTGVGEQELSHVTITQDSRGIGLHCESGSDNNYDTVIAHGAYRNMVFESGGHTFLNPHPYASPLDPGDASLVCHIDIVGASKVTFIGGNIDQLHTSGQYQVRIRTTTDNSCLRIKFVGTNWNNPQLDNDNVVSGVYMDASQGTNKWITASFDDCDFSGNPSFLYQYAFEKEGTNPGQIIYKVYGGSANNVTALWSHAPDHTHGFTDLSGGITEGQGGGNVTSGPFATKAGGELTIATGVITVTDSHHRVDTQSDASSDDLDTINGGQDGMILVIQSQDSARDVVCKDGTGNLALQGDFTLGTDQASLTLQYHSAQSEWVELSRSAGVGTVTYTAGAHSTLRDFTGTTTAAEALQLLETLVEDLQSRGIVG